MNSTLGSVVPLAMLNIHFVFRMSPLYHSPGLMRGTVRCVLWWKAPSYLDFIWNSQKSFHSDRIDYPARALRALGLLLADGAPTVGGGEDFLSRQPDFFTETAVTPERKVEKSFPRWEINRHVEG